MTGGRKAAALRKGLVDVAFVRLPSDLTGLRSEMVRAEPRVAWVDGTDNNLVRGFARVVGELAAGGRTGGGPVLRSGRAGRGGGRAGGGAGARGAAGGRASA
ncbi:hypothetical protein ACFV6W_36045, partial [Streptomyces sp. NPDC059802]